MSYSYSSLRTQGVVQASHKDATLAYQLRVGLQEFCAEDFGVRSGTIVVVMKQSYEYYVLGQIQLSSLAAAQRDELRVQSSLS